jgi:hypothetical protein
MNARENWDRIMDYKKADAIPVLAIEWYFEDETIANWRRQGLPAGQNPEQYLKMDRVINLPINFSPIPEYEHQVIFEDERILIETDSMGATIKRDKRAPNLYYGYIDHPIKNMADWLLYKKRFQAGPERYFSKNVDESISTTLVQKSDLPLASDKMQNLDTMWHRYDQLENPVGINLIPFFMRLGFYTMGMERFMLAFYDLPEMIHDMFAFWSDFLLNLLRPVLGKTRIDFVSITEDLAYKNGPHFSPAIYKEFWLPYQTEIIQELKGAGIKLINLWTSGNIDALLPIMMREGINCTWPVDRYSNMDPLRLRRQYGKELRMVGGIPKQAVFDGPAAIDHEIERLMPLIMEGGFIPALDDVVPPETPFEHYVYLIRQLQAIRL